MAKRSNENRGPAPAELSGFCAEVALMLGAGMTLTDGMESMAENNRDSSNAKMYAALAQSVLETGSLYEALRKDSSWPTYLTEMVGIGERTGRLEEVMNGLSEYYEREGRIRSAIVSAVTYPVMLGVMMLLIVLIMILKVLPVFRRVLSSMGVAMTASGNMMMQIGVSMGWIVLAVVGVIVIAVLACVLLLKTGMRDKVMDTLRSVFPPLKRLSLRLGSSRVASILSMMLSGGFPLDEALHLVPNVLSDKIASQEITRIRQKMDGGTTFSDALTDSKLFDPMHTRMIRMAIAAGREDQVMDKVARVYEEQVEDGVAGLVSIIEPTLVALLSVVIGAILLSVMLPMAGIISSIL